MKIFICCLIVGIFSLILADVKNIEESGVEKKIDTLASDKSSDSKQKRDASLLNGIYHGPSYKYLPPSLISSYNSYSGNVGNSAGHTGGHIPNLRSGIGRGHNHPEFSTTGHHSSGSFHGLGYAPASSYHSSGHHGLGFPSTHFVGPGGFKSGAGFHNSGVYARSRPHSYAVGHGYSSVGSSSSGIGYKSYSHSLSGSNIGLGNGYRYQKGNSGSFSSPASSGFGSVHGYGSSDNSGSGLAEVHHGDHVHNGGQEHFYVIANSPGSPVGQHESHGVTAASYIPPIQQYPLPSSSYGVPIDSHNTKYHSQASADIANEPAYAAGHKGLGHFGFTANKPQVLHTSISGSSFKEPSYSKVPFKPSEFLGAKYEDSAQIDAPAQQYLSPSGAGNDATGYDYHIPSAPTINYLEPSYQQSVEVQTTSVHEPNSAYLPPNNEGSFNELHSAPSQNYLPPSNTYGVPYSR